MRIFTFSKTSSSVKFGQRFCTGRSSQNDEDSNPFKVFPPRGERYTEVPEKKHPRNPLMKHLLTMIKIGGPISVSTFMREALTNPNYGYYMKKEEIIGRMGDFTTSPEISQIFGELIGLWCVRMWEMMGKPKRLNIVEFGPGKGTLMNDMLKAFKVFPQFKDAIEINLIEISPPMRLFQASTLGIKLDLEDLKSKAPDQSEVGDKSRRKMPKRDIPGATPPVETAKSQPAHPIEKEKEKASVIEDLTAIRNDGLRVNWKQRLEDVDPAPSLIIAHEFFDALPVHQFQYHDGKWLELLVDIDSSPLSDEDLRFTLSPGPTILSQLFAKQLNRQNPKDGDRMEVSPQSLSVAQYMGDWINKHQGSALVIDYGHEEALKYSLRAIKDHQFLDNPLRDPGEADLSCDVDFGSILNAATLANRTGDGVAVKNEVHTFAPISQGEFLIRLGIETRVMNLLQKLKEEDKAAQLVNAFERLVSPEQMGTIYKVAAFSSKDLKEVAGFNE